MASGIISRVCEYLNKIITQSNAKLPAQNKRQTVGNSIYKRQTVQAVGVDNCRTAYHTNNAWRCIAVPVLNTDYAFLSIDAVGTFNLEEKHIFVHTGSLQ